jgi:hypothetical protein
MRVGRELGLMLATETSSARDVAGKSPGALVELKGMLHGDAPIKGEFSGLDCLYYRALVEREYEDVERDSDGRRETRRRYETVSSVERNAPCKLADASGAVAVDFTGAKVEAKQVHQRYEAAGGAGLVGALAGSLLNVGVTGQTLGHRYTEWIIAPDAPVYLLGTVLAGGVVGASPTKANPFLISIKSEEERTRSLGWTRLWLLVGSIACAAVAIAIIVFSLQSG